MATLYAGRRRSLPAASPLLARSDLIIRYTLMEVGSITALDIALRLTIPTGSSICRQEIDSQLNASLLRSLYVPFSPGLYREERRRRACAESANAGALLQARGAHAGRRWRWTSV